MQIELAKISGNNNQPNLNITPDQVKVVNKLSSKDITGNIFISNDNIKKLGLSDKQISNIVLAMSNYNKLPEELKDGTQQAIQVIINSSIQKQEELKQAELFDKVAQVLTSTINAHAGVCSNQYNNLGRYWWGMTIRGSQCFGYDVRNTFAISFAFATAVALLCTMAAVFAGAGAIACGIFITAWTTISSKIMLFGYDFAWKAGSCGGWVTANINYWGSYSLYC